MAKKCWTCGAEVETWSYTCPACQGSGVLQELRQMLLPEREFPPQVSGRQNASPLSCLQPLRLIQQDALARLESDSPESPAALASMLQWGFDEIEWQLFQQAEALHQLEFPVNPSSQQQADEWRIMAEELRRRGVFEDSEEFFLKALDVNRLDYRLYIGLAETYLRSNQFENAQNTLKKSLPHAPSQENFDFKSFSYRLIGHIHACEEHYHEALSSLRLAVTQSSEYPDGYYDAARYAARAGSQEERAGFLRNALKTPLYFGLAQKDRHFDDIREVVQQELLRFVTEHDVTPDYDQGMLELAQYWGRAGDTEAAFSLFERVIPRTPSLFQRLQNQVHEQRIAQDIQTVLDRIAAKARQEAEEALAESEQILHSASESIAETTRLAESFGDTYPLISQQMYEEAEKNCERARANMASREYEQLIAAVLCAKEAARSGENAEIEARTEREEYLANPPKRFRLNIGALGKTFLELVSILGSILFWMIFFGIVCAAIELFIALFHGLTYLVFFGGIALGSLGGLIFGYKIEGWRFKQIFR